MKDPVVKKGWRGVVVFSMLLGFFAFLVSAGVLNYYYSTLGWYSGIAIGILTFVEKELESLIEKYEKTKRMLIVNFEKIT